MVFFSLKRLVENNTFGIFPINQHTFNRNNQTKVTYPQGVRDIVINSFAVYTLSLNMLSYTKFYRIAAIARCLVGASFYLFTVCVGNRDAKRGLIIGHFYDEAIVTGVAQVARGMVDLWASNRAAVNAGLDLVSSFGAFVESFNTSAMELTGGNNDPYGNSPFSQFLMNVNALALSLLLGKGLCPNNFKNWMLQTSAGQKVVCVFNRIVSQANACFTGSI